MGFESNTGLGVLNHYGQRKIDNKYGGNLGVDGAIEQVQYVIDLAEEISGAPTTSNEVTTSSTYGLEYVFPAYAKIISARVEVIEALSTTGGTVATTASFQVGLEQADGTAIDVDGLIDATDGDLTVTSNNIAEPRGTVLVGSNAALVPNVSIGSAAGELTAKLVINDITNMTAVAGKVRIIVEYMPEGV